MYQVCVIDFTGAEELIVADSFQTMKEAVEDYTAGGWEDGENVRKQAVIIKDGDGKIEAVGTYVACDRNRMPVLVWVYAHGAMENRFYEQEYARYIGKEA
jgi:hypothetical protein